MSISKESLLNEEYKNLIEIDRIHLLFEYFKKISFKFTSQSKTRSDVVGSGKKLYKQKGTGRARPGSCKSPLKRGGGKAFGPVVRDPRISLNKKQKTLCFISLFKFIKPKIKEVNDTLSNNSSKTKDIVKDLDIIKNKKYYYFYSLTPNKLLSNIKNVYQSSLSNINILSCLNSDTVFIESQVTNQLKDLKYVK